MFDRIVRACKRSAKIGAPKFSGVIVLCNFSDMAAIKHERVALRSRMSNARTEGSLILLPYLNIMRSKTLSEYSYIASTFGFCPLIR